MNIEITLFRYPFHKPSFDVWWTGKITKEGMEVGGGKGIEICFFFMCFYLSKPDEFDDELQT